MELVNSMVCIVGVRMAEAPSGSGSGWKRETEKRSGRVTLKFS